MQWKPLVRRGSSEAAEVGGQRTNNEAKVSAVRPKLIEVVN
jgi:hypothetical protein